MAIAKYGKTALAKVRAAASNKAKRAEAKHKATMMVRAAESGAGAFAAGFAEGTFGEELDLGFVELPTSLTMAAVSISAGYALDLPDLMAFGHGAACGFAYDLGRDLAEGAPAE